MGSSSFANKRISYVLASIVLKENEELLTLVPNVFRKDLSNIQDQYTTSIALNCFSHLCTEDMA
jgi:AP-1 complex subunit gamma-1